VIKAGRLMKAFLSLRHDSDKLATARRQGRMGDGAVTMIGSQMNFFSLSYHQSAIPG
jgi:glutaredoxin-related protein